MTNNINSIPPPSLLQSAESSLQGGFDLLNKGAAEIVAGTTVGVEQPTPGVTLSARLTNGAVRPSGAADPALKGMLDTIRARGEEEAGAAMLHLYNRTRDDLFSLIAPDSSHGAA